MVEAEKAKEILEDSARPKTFAEYTEDYIVTKELSRAIRPVTASGYRSYLKKVIGTPLGSKRICEISARDILAWEKGLVADGLSRTSLSHIHVFAKQVCTYARKMGDLQSNPFDCVDAPARGSKPVNSLTTAEVAKMNRALEHFGQSALAVGAKLALMTGMRQAEICALRWQDVDYERRVVHVTHSLSRSSGRYALDRPKTSGSIRDIPFGDRLAAILSSRKRYMAEEREGIGLAWDDALYVIGSPVTGKPYSPQVLGHEWHAFARTASLTGTQGVPPRFHDLRHTFATLAISSADGGLDVKTVSAILGHSNAAMTLNVYADALADSKRAGMAQMDTLLSGK